MKQELVNPDLTIQDQDSSAELFGGDIMYHLSRTTLAAAAISWGSIATAFAADLGPHPAYKAMPVATVYDWTGLYIGAHAGWAGADRTFERTFIGGETINPGFSQHPNGFAGGGQIGFNRQTGNWVWGLEADISGTKQRSSTTVAGPIIPFFAQTTHTYDVSIDWTASLTGRLGYAWDRWMLYGKGGAAVMQETYGLRAPGLFPPDSPYHNAKVPRLGWTVGAGVENAFLDNWSWKAEYNYMRFDGNDSITNVHSLRALAGVTSHTEVNLHLVKAGINYRFGGPIAAPGIRPTLAYKAPVATVYDWTGLYVGGHAGSASAERNFLTIFDFDVFGFGRTVFSPPFTQKPTGFVGGGQVGFNRQAGSWVFGMEADASGTNLGARTTVIDSTATFLQTYHVEIDWTATLAGRVGYAWDRWMLYGKGGGALLRETYALSGPLLGARNDAHATRAGWTIGAGIENAFLDNWSWKAEYNFMSFGDTKTISNSRTTTNAVATANETNVNLHTVKLGVNYRFGNYGIVTKY
ncbi:outer membrane beta-barrel protein [Bradyrhizobium sp. JYMT SZCCT0180]|uniref:outer membrane protein n=1 Tax=Bradyrhizobium sp. JYMT SZCCT0180 TaxID=2807666 RepID=UPI001BA96DB6|nr:outer membrane beta-barrel protein [Bradyrhizobium sp. JYMT SZCCT0180]MBR1213763.1 porin family protein [Bradyrhizobium sp. JYMT SZCCT0180]